MSTSDKDQKEQGKTVQFGIGQIGNPTPLVLKYAFRGLAFLSGAWALLSGNFDVSPDMVSEINKWLLVGNTFMLYAIKFFGWQKPE